MSDGTVGGGGGWGVGVWSVHVQTHLGQDNCTRPCGRHNWQKTRCNAIGIFSTLTNSRSHDLLQFTVPQLPAQVVYMQGAPPLVVLASWLYTST